MGAEYVWLDAVCLRQRGRDEDEALRRAEWKVDVPTIGYIYSYLYKPCITYFNGLGLPIDTSSTTLESKRHWYNRVWTLQECMQNWIPGGLTGESLPDDSAFFTRLDDLVDSRKYWQVRMKELVQALNTRQCATEVDRVAGLPYLLRCPSLPLYDETIPVESAWVLMLKHMMPWMRNVIFLRYTTDTPYDLWVSWERFLTSEPTLPMTTIPDGSAEEHLDLVHGAQLYSDEPGMYHHKAYAIGPCRIIQSSEGAWQLRFLEGEPITMQVTHMHGLLIPDVDYVLLGVGNSWKEHWVVVEIVGERGMGQRMALEVVKWGVLCVEEDEGNRLVALGIGCSATAVIYLASEEAVVRSHNVRGGLELSTRRDTLHSGL